MSAMDKMMTRMSKMYPLLILMGFMMVIIAFIIGFVNAGNAADYYEIPKGERDTSTDSSVLDNKASIASVGLWLPYFKFLGVGLLLGGIVMALRVIIDNLRDVGTEVLTNLDEKDRPALPTPPWYAMLMPMLMMLGELIFIIAFIISLTLASDARGLFGDNSIKEIDNSTTLTSTLQDIKSNAIILVPLKFFAVATEFLAIAIGLATIIYILTAQTEVIDKALTKSKGGKA